LEHYRPKDSRFSLGELRPARPTREQLAKLNLEGKVQTTVEHKGAPSARIHFAGVDVAVFYGFSQHDGEVPSGTPDASVRVILAPVDFLVIGFDASVTLIATTAPGATPRNEQLEILSAEQGQYVGGAWQNSRNWNRDQTDRGLKFKSDNKDVVRIRLHILPLYDLASRDAVH
jgi:hypothetical protein